MSIGLHAVLVVSASTAGPAAAYVRGASSGLRVALIGGARVQALTGQRETADELPSRLTPIVNRTRGYPKLLSFAAIELPPPRFDEAAYRPLSSLTTAPAAAHEIEISNPRHPDQTDGVVAALTLFIDEDGTVANVRVEEPRVPAEYEQIAITAFSNARFNPGVVGDRPVKSRILIRVAFEGGVAPRADHSELAAVERKP